MSDARAREQLRQERETFDQAKTHGAQWFRLRLCMAYATIALLILVAIVCAVIVIRPAGYPVTVITAASAALLVDIVALAAGIFKLVLPHSSAASLKPITVAKAGASIRP